MAAGLFGFLDAHYLRQERAFRALYRAAVENRVDEYDMNNRVFYGKPNRDEDDLREENCNWPKIICSWSVLGFYAPVIALGVVVVLCSASWPATACTPLG